MAAEHIGRRTRCPNCKSPFEVQPAESTPVPTPEQEALDDPPAVMHVGVNCQLCGTRMYGRLDQVGQLMKCPDCDTKTVLPPPEPPKGPVMPAAMLGEQYELWEGDDQPWGITLAAAQAELIAVHCELCDTLQHVAPAMVGSAIVCPDCGHATRVRAAKPKPTSTRDVAKAEQGELELEPAAVSHAMATPSEPLLYSRLQDFESKSTEDQEK
ncbi:hypothetical protein N9N28_17925, partial [Rubripirellula amarantea]|nr:hypothetical protein [Rubripirellula amarantea]